MGMIIHFLVFWDSLYMFEFGEAKYIKYGTEIDYSKASARKAVFHWFIFRIL